jgi:kynurenine 3-monooxygenase
MRRDDVEAGRSINLVLTSRGVDSLEALGLTPTVQPITLPVIGRTLHAVDGALQFTRYGLDDTCCNYSVSRSDLNKALMTAAERAGARIHFDTPLAHLDIEKKTMYSYVFAGGKPTQTKVQAKHFFATDGGGSRSRQALKGLLGAEMKEESVPLGCSYKELVLPARADGGYCFDEKTLHIWPRGSHFLMGLPNLDGSYTMTLYAPAEGDISFAKLKTPDALRAYFETYYADVLPRIAWSSLRDQFFANPCGFLGTIYQSPWSYQSSLLCMGDASHAITPFFGQGCNSAFEDVRCFFKTLHASHPKQSKQRACPGVMAKVFRDFFAARKAPTDAIAAMAVDNYAEMMTRTGDPRFLLKQEVDMKLTADHAMYVSRYVMVTHSLIPYHVCEQTGEIQTRILDELCPASVTRVDQVDWAHADRLVRERLLPFLAKQGITDPSAYEDKTHELMNRKVSRL